MTMNSNSKDCVLNALEDYRINASKEQKAKDEKWLNKNCKTNSALLKKMLGSNF